MKRVLLFLFVVLGLAVSGFAQNDKISYQAVVRNSANQIVYNTELTVTINIANSEGGEVVYSERHTVTSNANGLISLLIGNGEVLSGSWDAVPWNTAYMTASIANTASSETVASHALPLSAVPYAMYANYADSVNTEVIAHYLLDNGYLAVDSTLFFNLLDSLRILDLRLVADSMEFADYLSNTSAQIETTLDSIVYILNYLQMMNHAIDGDFTDLVDSIGAISWRQTNNYYTKSVIDAMLSHYATRSALDSTDAAIRADFPVVNNATLTIRSNGDSVGVFTANANENVTIDIPAQANVQSDWNVTDTTSDAFIKHKPDIPTVPTNVSAFTNDAGYITTTDIPTNVSAFTNDVGYITSDTVGNAIHDSIVNNISQQIHDSISSHPETDPLFSAWDKDYNDLTNKPDLFDGNYNSLTNKPSIKDTVSNAIHDSIVNNISQQIHDSISNIQIGSDNVQSDWNQTDTTADDYIKHKPELFSGNYDDLTNKPAIPTVPTNVGAFTNDAGYITSETVGNTIHDSIVNNISQQIHDSISNIQVGSDNVQSDWSQTDTTADDFIKHKPTKLTDFVNDAGFLTEANVQEAANIPTNVSAFTNDAGYITSDTVGNAIHDSIVNNISQQIHDSIYSHPETDPLFSAWDKDYNDLTNKPELFDGNYNSLTNKPSIKDTVSEAIHDSIVNNISQQIHDSISHIQIGSDNVQSDWTQTDTTADDYIKHKPELFSGNYDDLTNKPAIPTVPTDVSAFTNDAGYLTADSALIVKMLDSLQNLSLRLKADSTALQHHIAGTSTIPQTIDSIRTALANINVTNQAVNGDFSQLIADINTLTAQLNNDYYTKTKINDTLDDYYTKTQVDSVSTQIRSEIPAVHNATLTIKSNGDSIGVFTANANQNVIIDIPAQANVQSDWSQTDTTADDYIKHKPELFSGNYEDLANKPELFSGDYDDLTNKPELFDGNYNSLTNKPSIKDTVSEAIHDSIVNRISAQIHDSISAHPETDPQFNAWDKDYNDLTNKPELFDGNYNSLTNRPSIKDTVSNAIHDSIVNNISQQIHDSISHIQVGSDNVQSDWNQTDTTADDYIKHKPELFSGNYDDLTNKPAIPTVPTDVSAFTNDAGYLTADSALIVKMLDSLQNLSLRLKADSTALQHHIAGTSTIPQTIDSIRTALANINVTNQAVNGDFSQLIADINTLTARLNNDYYTKTKINDTLDDYYTKSQVDSVSTQIRSEIPAVHNATLTIKSNGDSIGVFTANANQNVIIDIPAQANVQSDWAQTDTTADDYIKHKPELFSGNYGDLANKPELFSGDYDDLTNKPNIDSIAHKAVNDTIHYYVLQDDLRDTIGHYVLKDDLKDTIDYYVLKADIQDSIAHNVLLTRKNDTLFLTNGTEIDTVKLPEGFDGDYNSLTNKPELFDGNYNDLTNKPNIDSIAQKAVNDTIDYYVLKDDLNDTIDHYVLKDDLNDTIGHYVLSDDLKDTIGHYVLKDDLKDTIDYYVLKADIRDSIAHNVLLTRKNDTLFLMNGTEIDTINLPEGFDGDYFSLTNLPQFATVATTGNYEDLTNKPTIPTVPTNVGAFTNDAGYLTADSALIVSLLDSLQNLSLRLKADSAALQSHLSGTTHSILQEIDSIKIALASINITNQAVNGDFSNLLNSINELKFRLNNHYYTILQVDSISSKIRSEIPAVHNATLTIKNNEATLGQFTANANQNVTIDVSSLSNVQSDWNQADNTKDDYIKNKPNIKDTVSEVIHDSIVYNISAQIHDSISGITETDPLFSAWDKDYNDLINTPELETVATSGDYNDLVNKPSIKDTVSAAIHDSIVYNISAQIHDSISGITETDPLFTAWGKDYNTLLNKPVIKDTVSAAIHDSIVNRISAQIHDSISGITETDPLFSAWDKDYNDLINTPELETVATSGDYNDLVNKPSIKDTVSAAIHDSIVNSISAQIHDSISGITETDPLFSAWDKDYNDLINTPELETVATSGDYNDLVNKPSIKDTVSAAIHDSIVYRISEQIHDSISGITETDPLFTSWNKSYNDLTDKPELFDGDYSSLANRPSIKDTVSAAIHDSIVNRISEQIHDSISGITETDPLFTSWNKSYNDLTDKPELFDGDYSSLANKPSIKDTVSAAIHDSIVYRISEQIHDSISGITETDPLFTAWDKDYNSLTNKPDLFDGNYNSLTNKPSIKDTVSAAIHDSIVNRISKQIHDSISGISISGGGNVQSDWNQNDDSADDYIWNKPSIKDTVSEAIHDSIVYNISYQIQDSLNTLKKGIRDVSDTAYTSSLLPVEKSKILIIDEDQDPQIPVFKICQLDKKPNNAYLVKIFINGVLVGDNAPANGGSDSHYAPVLRVEQNSSEKYEIKYDSDKNEGYLLEKGDKIILYWFE